MTEAPEIPAAKHARLLEFDLLRALCAFGVLLIHISSIFWGLKELDTDFTHLMTFSFLNEAVRYALFGFMFLSGALITIHYGGRFRAIPFIGKRVTTVLIPYLVWVVIFFFLQINVNHQAYTQFNNALHGDWSYQKIVISWILFGTWDHLYFINMIFQMYLLYAIFHHPITWLLATRRRALGFLVVILLLYPCWILFSEPALYQSFFRLPHLLGWVARHHNRFAFEWMAPFTSGLVFGAYRADFMSWSRRYRSTLWLLIVGTLLTTVAIVAVPWFSASTTADLMKYIKIDFPYGHGIPLHTGFLLPVIRLAYSFSFTCLALVAFTKLVERSGDKQPLYFRFALSFSLTSFGVYLFHPILLEWFRYNGFSLWLYQESAYLYLLVIILLVTGISYLFVLGIITLGRRLRAFRWLPKLLFGI